MRMLGTVLSNLQRLVNWLITAMSNVMTSAQQQLSKITGVLTTAKTQFVALVSNLSSQLVLIVQKFKVLLAQFTTLVSSTKLGLTSVKAILTQLGQQLVTTARQTLQHVKSVQQLSSVLVENIKLAVLHIQKQAVALIPMAIQLKDNGLKLLGIVRQLPQRVVQALFRGH